MTVIELMIGSALLLVVTLIAFQGLITLQNTANVVDKRGQTTDQAHLALEQIETEVRSSNLLYTPTSSPTASISVGTAGSGPDLVVFTQTNGNFTCVQWKTVSGVLETRTYSPTWSTDGIESGWRTVATNIVNGTSHDPLYPGSSTPVFSVTANSPTLTVDLLVNADQGQSNYLSLQTSVTGRDIEYNTSSSSCSLEPS